MKTLGLLIAAIVSFATLTPVTASAGGHCRPGSSRVSYDSCGRQFISIYTFVGRDRCGAPIFRWVGRPSYNRHVYRGGGYGRGYDRGGYGRGGYAGGGHRHGGGSRGGVGFSIRVGR